jgi:CRISPR/Cas system-associated exonuclease Cas4 (RecB family)
LTLPPPDVDIQFPDYTEIILKAIDQPMKVRDGVQITDLTLCPRRKIFEIVNPKEQSRQTIVRTAAGKGLHRFVQKKIKNPDPDRYEAEMPVEVNDFIYGSIDLYDKELEIVIDIKEKVVNGSWEIRPLSSQEEQLKDLMAMKNVSKGALVLILVNGKEAIKQFNYYMTEEERLEQLRNLNEKGSLFLTAKNNRDPSIANYAFFDRSLNWLCHRIDKKTADHVWCPYYWDCMALIAREKNGLNDSQAERFD